MKTTFFLFLIILCHSQFSAAYGEPAGPEIDRKIRELVASYNQARETQDARLLESILVEDIDQLVSNGEWRRGRDTALAGMRSSSSSRPGKRTLTVDTVRLLSPGCAIADARYEIENPDGSLRKMWSCFVVTLEDGRWKIAAIRNMLPAQ